MPSRGSLLQDSYSRMRTHGNLRSTNRNCHPTQLVLSDLVSQLYLATAADAKAGGLRRQGTQVLTRKPGTLEGGKPNPQRTPSQRRMHRPQQPPGSDTEPEPPVNRQSARPIFGGIAKMVRTPSGTLPIVSWQNVIP